MYCSGKKDETTYSAEMALEHIRAKDDENKSVKIFTDDDYRELDITLREYNKKKPKKRQITV